MTKKLLPLRNKFYIAFSQCESKNIHRISFVDSKKEFTLRHFRKTTLKFFLKIYYYILFEKQKSFDLSFEKILLLKVTSKVDK